MRELPEQRIQCPYCGENIDIVLDVATQDFTDTEYIEDCQVCCRPITIRARVMAGEELSVAVFHENE